MLDLKHFSLFQEELSKDTDYNPAQNKLAWGASLWGKLWPKCFGCLIYKTTTRIQYVGEQIEMKYCLATVLTYYR